MEKIYMKLLLENWRKYLTEEEKHDLEQMATMQGWSTEQTIARIVIAEDWKYARKMFFDNRDTLDLDVLTKELSNVLQEQWERIHKEYKARRKASFARMGRGKFRPFRVQPANIVHGGEDYYGRPTSLLDKILNSVISFLLGYGGAVANKAFAPSHRTIGLGVPGFSETQPKDKVVRKIIRDHLENMKEKSFELKITENLNKDWNKFI